MTEQLITGSAHDTGLPDKSVHTVITSPPYWGLRKYTGDQGIEWPAVSYSPMPGLPELHIQGCDAECDHEWQDGPLVTVGNNRNVRSQNETDDKFSTPKWEGTSNQHTTSGGTHCLHCGGWHGELGLEPTPEMYIGHMLLVMREMWRVLRDDGVMFCNMGDGYQDKQLTGMPWRLAFALQADGWYLRSDIIWAKPNPMPESVTDRPTKAHEYLFLLSKQAKYYYDADAVREGISQSTIERWGGVPTRIDGSGSAPDRNDYDGTGGEKGMGVNPAGRNRRTVWHIATQPTKAAHFATFPEALVEPCIRAGTSQHGCCVECGAPWERVVERNDVDNSINEVIEHTGVPGIKKGTSADRVRSLSGATYQHVRKATDTWQPTCTCDLFGSYFPQPCTVLDPFSGSGTTGRVAIRLNRHYIGVDISQEYHEDIAEERLGGIQRELVGV